MEMEVGQDGFCTFERIWTVDVGSRQDSGTNSVHEGLIQINRYLRSRTVFIILSNRIGLRYHGLLYFDFC